MGEAGRMSVSTGAGSSGKDMNGDMAGRGACT